MTPDTPRHESSLGLKTMLDARDFEELFSRPQFSIAQESKERILLAELRRLILHHAESCRPYKAILSALGLINSEFSSIDELPYIPVSLFKTHSLASVAEDQCFKIITSSGTSGGPVSRIVLDRRTAQLQSRALSLVMAKVLGTKRLPMLIADSPSTGSRTETVSARSAGILGMLPFGRKHFYALNENMQLDVHGLRMFLEEFGSEPFLLFGFTFMVWKHLFNELARSKVRHDFSNGILIHSGGWKALEAESIDNETFRRVIADATGLTKIHNFYGMAEQVGSVFLEGDDGFLYPPNFADVIIRSPATWRPVADGQPGVVEVLSVLPRSYPGHVLLTEDMGIIHGIGSDSSGWAGKQLQILGRVPRSELRGCSDTYASRQLR